MQNDKPQPAGRRAVLGQVFLVVFIDLIGFSVIFPLFPAMLDHYLAFEGPDSLVGRLVGRLAALAGGGEGASFAVAALFGGVLGSLYSGLQFLFAPVWGALSDRHGRRPVLVMTLTGTLLSYVLWFFAGTFPLLLAARFFGGIMAGNVSTATAVIADVTSGRERAKGMGIVGMAIGLGFILGPALGGLGSLWDLSPELADGARPGVLSVNPFSVPAGFAFLLALVNLVWVFARFPETRRAAPAEEGGRSLSPLARLRTIHLPGVVRTNVVYFVYLLAFSAVEFTLTFLTFERLGYGPGANAWMFVYVGLLIALVQGGVVRRVAPRYGEKRVALFGIAVIVPGFVLIGLCESSALLYAGLTCMALGSALAMPTLGALVSRYVPDDRQGLALGSFRSAGALSRAVGPILGGLLYWQLGSAAPYLAGAAVLAIPLGLALGLPPVPPEPQAAEAEPVA